MAFLKLLLISSLLVGYCQGTIDSSLLNALGSNGRSDVLINFKGDNSRAIHSIAGKTFKSRLSRVKALNKALRSSTEESQGPVADFLKEQGVESQSFWSSNQMVVRSANVNLLKSIDSFSQVRRIQQLPRVQLSPVQPSSVSPAADNVEWGVAKIQADKVWDEFGTKGEGVVVANIDTGVRGTHEALAGNYRNDHGWFDPYTFTEEPDDGNGHGTHTMGTIAGQGGIGVAPGSTWIACRGCGSDSCDSAQLLACGQFMLAPTLHDGTDGREDLIPDVVSNSWGSSIGGSDWYNATIEAWTAAGIMHTFAIGNSGPLCRSGGSPGDQPTTFSIGSTDINDKLSLFSSKGPAGGFWGIGGIIKPDVVAPGSDVRSAWHTADDGYNTISGTSMATPHVTGVMALMLSAHRNNVGADAKIPQEVAATLLEETVDTKGLALSTFNFGCDFLFFASDRFPNNQFGYGRVNAMNALNATMKLSSEL